MSRTLKSEGVVMHQPNKKKGFDEWEIRQALEDLERAEKVKSNPDLMKEVEKAAKQKVDFLKRIKWVK